MSPELNEQLRVSKMLAYGFVLSILGVGGIASMIALVLGLKARRIIKQSDAEVSGIKMAWWCIIVGGLGTVLLPTIIIALLLNENL